MKKKQFAVNRGKNGGVYKHMFMKIRDIQAEKNEQEKQSH